MKFDLVSLLEFNDREDGYKGIQKKYDLNFKDVKTMEPKLRYQALESNDIDLIDAYSTDAELKEYGMVVLEDDKNYSHHTKVHHL